MRIFSVIAETFATGLLVAFMQSSAALAADAVAPSADISISSAPVQVRSVSVGGRVVDMPMEDPTNPLVQIATTSGDIVIELFPREAPETVANFLGLATGTKPFIDVATGEELIRPFYDGLVFHRVIDSFMIQSGSPTGLGDGFPGYRFPDEISAQSLGLDKMLVLDADGVPNAVLGIRSQQDFQQRVLGPLYQSMNITSQQQLDVRTSEVDERLRKMTVQNNYELMGYHYRNDLLSRAPLRGVIAMANSGPDSNGSQFFITLVDTPWLTGKHTVFGKVRAGLDVVDAIGKMPVNADARPLQDVSILAVTPL